MHLEEHKTMSCDYFGAKPVPGDGIEERCGMERTDVNHGASEDVPQPVGQGNACS